MNITWKNINYFITYNFYNCINRMQFKWKKVLCGKNIHTFGKIYIKNEGRGIKIGSNCCFNSSFWSNPVGGEERIILRTLEKGRIILGDGVGMSNSVIVSAEEVEIGDNVMIGAGVKIYDTDFHSLKYDLRIVGHEGVKKGKIKIEEGAFIGAGTFILKGVTVGEKSVVGAGSVVTKNIPPQEVWAGNPAKFIKKL